MPPHFDGEPFRLLDKQIEFMLLGHQIIVDLLETPNLDSIINGLRDPAVRSAASADPLKFAQDSGVILPATGVSIQIHEFPHSWEVEIQIVQGASLFIVGLNSRKGFFTR